MVFVSSGSGYFVDEDGAEHAVVAPALISLTARREHGYGPSADGWMEHWVLFDGALVQAIAELGMLRRGGVVIPIVTALEEVPALFAELRVALSSSAPPAQLKAAAICQLLLAVAAVEWSEGATDGAVPEVVISALRERAAEKLSLAERAQALGITESELRSIVLSATGRSPHDFVVAARIERASALLVDTELTVREISDAVGYADSAFFSRIFRRKVGLPPTTFRAVHSAAR